MERREAKPPAAVNDIFAQAYGDFYNTVFGLFVTQRVVVERAPYTGERGEVIAAAVFAYYFLYDHGHLLLVDDIACGCHVGLAGGIEHRGVYTLYGRFEPCESGGSVGGIWHHVGGVDTGERLVV